MIKINLNARWGQVKAPRSGVIEYVYMSQRQ